MVRVFVKIVLLIGLLTVASSLSVKHIRSIKRFSASLIASITLTGSPVFADAIPLIGASAPEFSLPSNTGSDISLTDLVNSKRWTVLYFYPGDFTSGCTIEAKSFEKDIDKYKELNAEIVGVSVDTVDKHLDFKKKYGLDFPLLSDVGGVVSNKYGSLLNLGFLGKFSNRQTYLISPEGKVQYVFTDVEGRINSHSTDVLEKLKSLQGSN